MALHPERSDIDISKLFKWGKKVSIYDASNTEMLTCYIKLVGDSEMNRARVYALRKSAELRKKLRTPGSDEKVAYIVEKEFVTKEELVQYVLLLKNKDIVERAYSEVKVPFPKEPSSEAGLEAQEKYQLSVDDFSNNIKKAVEKFVLNEIEKEGAELNKKDVDTLYKTYESLVIDDFCQLEMLNAFKNYCVSVSAFKDDKYTERLFTGVEEFSELPTEIKNQFEEEYSSLEIDINTLKKLPEAMPS